MGFSWAIEEVQNSWLIFECVKEMAPKKLEQTVKKLRDEFQVAGDVKMQVGRGPALPTIKPPTFAEKSFWCNYQKQFEAAGKNNAWTEEEKATNFTVALRGNASEIL